MPLSPRLRWKIDRFRDKLNALFGPRKENARPRLCPACGTLVGSTATRCHQCGASMTFSLAAASKSLGRLMPMTSPATYFILGLSFLLYGLSYLMTLHAGGSQQVGSGLSALFDLGGVSGNVLLRMGESLPLPYNLQEPWRFVSAVFLHFSLIHIGFNMWVLMDIGPAVEERYGSARFFFAYVLTGIAGYVLSSFFGHYSVGGSGALLGLIGMMLAVTVGRRSAEMQLLRQQLIRWLIYIVILGFLPGIDNLAHLGGFLSGFGLGKLMRDRPPADVQERKRAQILGFAAGLAVVASFAMVVLRFIHPA